MTGVSKKGENAHPTFWGIKVTLSSIKLLKYAKKSVDLTTYIWVLTYLRRNVKCVKFTKRGENSHP